MSWMSFVARLVEALAWPIAAVVGVLVFRRPLIDAIKSIRSLKIGNSEATFERSIESVEVLSQAIEPAENGVAAENDPDVQRLLDMADASPSGAIVESWKKIETAARELAERSGHAMASDTDRPLFNLQGFLSRYELLPPAELGTFRELRLVRNRAAHASGFDVSAEQAKRYVEVADRLIDAIKTFQIRAGRPSLS